MSDSLSDLTGADVAAGMDKTGSPQLRGDWDLEYLRGHIDTVVAFSTELIGNGLGLLGTVAITARQTIDSDSQVDQSRTTLPQCMRRARY